MSAKKAPQGAKPKAEIMAVNRKVKRAKGLKPVQVWVLPKHEAEIKAIEASSQAEAGYITGKSA